VCQIGPHPYYLKQRNEKRMPRHKTIDIDDSDIHAIKKYGIIFYDNVTVRYVKEKFNPVIEVRGGVVD
jgi:hypothetical protein